MKKMCYCMAVVFLLAAGTSFTFAGGFQLNEHGTKAMGMGGAFAAQASDGSAMFFNPAGLGFQQGLRAMVGATAILPSNKFYSPTIAELKMVKQTFYLPHGYVSYGMDNGLTVGLSFTAPYGLGTEWPSTWAGRYLAVKTDLKSYHINATVAYKINDQFAVGAGVTYVHSSVKLNRKLQLVLPTAPPTVLPDGDLKLDGKGNGVDFSVGLLTKPTAKLSVGVSYRHSNKINYEGDAVLTNMGPLAPYFPGGKGKTTIIFPNNAFLGVAYQVIPDLTLEADFQYIEWSKYDTLRIDIPVGPTFGAPLNRPLQGPSTSPKDWDNTYMLRFGAEYRLGSVAIRGGYIFDKSPQPSSALEPMLPDADRKEWTAGLGYPLTKELSVDVAYQYIRFKTRTVTAPANPFPGTYKGVVHLFGLSLGYAM